MSLRQFAYTQAKPMLGGTAALLAMLDAIMRQESGDAFELEVDARTQLPELPRTGLKTLNTEQFREEWSRIFGRDIGAREDNSY